MRTSGIFQTSRYRITLKSETDYFYLVPFSDVHRDHPQFAKTEWDEFRAWGKATPNAHFIGNGDYTDAFRAHTRSHILTTISEEERHDWDKQQDKRVTQFAKEIEFMRGRLVGLGDGNHTWQFVGGESFEKRLARTMGCPHLGVSAVIQFVVEVNGKRCQFLYAQHHGKAGGGTTVGGPYNTIANWAKSFTGVTIFAMGDDHSRGFVRGRPLLEFFHDKTSGRLLPRAIPQFYCRTGSFKRVYEPGLASYEIDRGYGPTDIGAMKFKIKAHRSARRGFHLTFEGIV